MAVCMPARICELWGCFFFHDPPPHTHTPLLRVAQAMEEAIVNLDKKS